MAESTPNETLVYMPLLDEGIDVSRPARAIHRGDGVYQIIEQEVCSTERWAYPPGSLVYCEVCLSGSDVIFRVVRSIDEGAAR